MIRADHNELKEKKETIILTGNPLNQSFARNHGFFIAIESYQHVAALRTPLQDIKMLADILAMEVHGYTIHPLVINPDKAALITFLTETLPSEVGPEDRVLLYFAGHSIAIDEVDMSEPKGFLLPCDALRNDESTFISMTEFSRLIQFLPCRHFLLLLDCCFAGSFQWAQNRERSIFFDSLPKCIYRQRFDYFIHEPAWQVALLEALREAVGVGLRRLTQVPLAVADQPRVVVDLSSVPLMDSLGLDALLDARDRCQTLGGAFVLARPNALCRDILRINGIDKEINVYDDVVKALGSFAR